MKFENAFRRGPLVGRSSVDTLLHAATLLLLTLLAVQTARLFWVVVAPLDPVGKWRAPRFIVPQAGTAASGFDPFFRLSAQSGEIAVTSLLLKLFGVRLDQATGRGSAIIATPDGIQSSFAVGDEIMPGVILKQVSADSATITREGSDEQLFLDQSVPASAAETGLIDPGVSSSAPIAQASGDAISGGAATLTGQIGFTPRANGGGVVVNPEGGGAAFRAAGLQPGDVLLSVNGKRLQSVEDSVIVFDSLPAVGAVVLSVERGGRQVTINAKGGQ